MRARPLTVKEKMSFSLVCAATWFANEVMEILQENWLKISLVLFQNGSKLYMFVTYLMNNGLI